VYHLSYELHSRDDYAPDTESEVRYSYVMERDAESLENELEAIAHWDRGLIFQDSISALDHLSYELRKERNLEIEAELRKRNEI
jgi:hypothetical protein